MYAQATALVPAIFCNDSRVKGMLIVTHLAVFTCTYKSTLWCKSDAACSQYFRVPRYQSLLRAALNALLKKDNKKIKYCKLVSRIKWLLTGVAPRLEWTMYKEGNALLTNNGCPLTSLSVQTWRLTWWFVYIVSWEPEGRYHYSKMFRWIPRRALSL